jgi:hypothetical protein
MFDPNCALRVGTAGTITATGDGSSVDFGGHDLKPRTYMAHVGVVAGTDTPTITVSIQESDNNSTWRTFASMQAITAAGQYYVTAKSNARYRRATWVVSGTNPVFGAATPAGVEIGPVPGGRHTNW